MKNGKGISACENNSPYQLVYLQHVAHYADTFQNMILGPTPWKKKQITDINTSMFSKLLTCTAYLTMKNGD